MPIFCRNFAGPFEAQLFLQGAVRGGRNLAQGVVGLTGLTITFANPSFSHTFVQTTNDNPDLFLIGDIKTQLETASTNALVVLQRAGYLILIEAVPSTGVSLAVASPAESARALLGFSAEAETSGVVFAAPDGTAPRLITAGADGGAWNVVTEEP